MALLHGIWKPGMALGIEELDEHHRTLLSLILDTKNAVANNEPPRVVREIIDSLKSYAMYHFKTEERYMLNRKYAGLEAHRELHRNFVERINNLSLDFPMNPRKTNVDLLQYLSSWFIGHILQQDRKFLDEE